MTLKLSRKQKEFYLDSNYKFNIAHGSVRSGKTFSVNLRWLKYIKNGPKGKLLMSGRTLSTLKENVLDDIFAIIGKENYTWKANGDCTIFGRKIKCVGADKIDAEGRIRGQTYAGWYADEVTIQHPAFVKQAITRCSVTGAKMFWTTNPDHPKHHIKVDFIDNETMKEKNMLKHWHFTLADNPNLSDDYIETLKASFSGVFYSRNIDGLWVIAEGVVYGKDYNPKIHKRPKYEIDKMLSNNEFHTFVAGTDFGYTHPMTGLIYGLKGDALYPEYYQIREYYKTEQKTEDLIKFYTDFEAEVNKKIKIIFCDSAEPDRVLAMQEAGLRATTGDKQINTGINTVQTLFKNDRLYISDRCDNTDHELQTYRYPNEDDGEAKMKQDGPMDEDNHAMDGKRYCLHNYEKYLIGQRRKDEKQKRKKHRKKTASA